MNASKDEINDFAKQMIHSREVEMTDQEKLDALNEKERQMLKQSTEIAEQACRKDSGSGLSRMMQIGIPAPPLFDRFGDFVAVSLPATCRAKLGATAAVTDQSEFPVAMRTLFVR